MPTPTPYEDWRKDPVSRAEDAASNFGHYLMACCRAGALKKIASLPAPATKAEFDAALAQAVDAALFNVTDLLEGFWPTRAGPKHRTEFELAIRVTDEGGNVIERIEVSPCMLDLPIGFWRWKEDFERTANAK
ncbi:MAG: hypothetical protein JST92_25110 [Deltaproteobacteria bacterium]|nr:hypothetical protein [Deltaproteobacteria bacterium]